MSTSPTWVDDHWWDQSSVNLDKKPLSYYNWTNIKRGNIIVMGQFKHKEYVAWWRSSGSPLSIAGIGKSGQIVRGDIWTRKSIPQPADPTTTQTLNIWSISIQYMIYVEKNCPGRHMDIWIRKSNPQPADPTTTQTLNPNLWIQKQQW